MSDSLIEQIYEDTNEQILKEVIEKTQAGSSDSEIDEYLRSAIEEVIHEWDKEALTSGGNVLSEEDRQGVRDRFMQALGYGQLEKWLTIPEAENVHIFGSEKVVVSYSDGSRKIWPPSVNNDSELIELIRFLATTKSRTARRFDISSPILDLRLPSGHRLFAIMGVSDEPYVVIRYHRDEKIDLETLKELGTITEPMMELLRCAILPPRPANILIGGGTSTGKTTTLRSFISQVPKTEILVTIEDTLEIHLRETGQHDLCFELETRQANIEGAGEITMYDLTRAALRMAPDRVIVGEVRGGEIMQLLTAMGQGNDGSIGTIHANSSEAVIARILTYSQRSPDASTPDFVLRQTGQTLNMIVFMTLLPGQRRVISSIREVLGYYKGEVFTSEIFSINEDYEVQYLHPPHPKGELLEKLRASDFDVASLGKPLYDTHKDYSEIFSEGVA